MERVRLHKKRREIERTTGLTVISPTLQGGDAKGGKVTPVSSARQTKNLGVYPTNKKLECQKK